MGDGGGMMDLRSADIPIGSPLQNQRPIQSLLLVKRITFAWKQALESGLIVDTTKLSCLLQLAKKGMIQKTGAPTMSSKEKLKD